MIVKPRVKLIGIAAPVIAIVTVLFLFGQAPTNSPPSVPRAAIIDSLYDDIPNTYFHDKAKGYLEAAGYQVDIFTTSNATVDLFKSLPSRNYGFIVIRSHALDAESEGNDVMIFTGEKYTEKKYIQEQLLGQIKKGAPLLDQTFLIDPKTSSGWIPVNGSNSTRMMIGRAIVQEEKSQEYFLVPPKMVDDLMTGRFPDSTIVLGGCSTLANPSLAESLVKRGASDVIGWSDLVSSSDNDRTMLEVLESILIDKMDSQKSVELANQHRDFKQKYNATLQVYSEET
jgi:hypothetical protein